jgi:hypothetical protein
MQVLLVCLDHRGRLRSIHEYNGVLQCKEQTYELDTPSLNAALLDHQ